MWMMLKTLAQTKLCWCRKSQSAENLFLITCHLRRMTKVYWPWHPHQNHRHVHSLLKMPAFLPGVENCFTKQNMGLIKTSNKRNPKTRLFEQFHCDLSKCTFGHFLRDAWKPLHSCLRAVLLRYIEVYLRALLIRCVKASVLVPLGRFIEIYRSVPSGTSYTMCESICTRAFGQIYCDISKCTFGHFLYDVWKHLYSCLWADLLRYIEVYLRHFYEQVCIATRAFESSTGISGIIITYGLGRSWFLCKSSICDLGQFSWVLQTRNYCSLLQVIMAVVWLCHWNFTLFLFCELYFQYRGGHFVL